MATSQEKKELVENLKGPHFYRITVNGYGGETVFATISEEAKNYWWRITDEHGDSDLVQYCVNADEYTAEEIRSGQAEIEFDYIDLDDLTDDVLFLHDPTEPEATGRPWYECNTEVFHNYAAEFDAARIIIEKVEDAEYNSKFIEEVVDENISDFVEAIGEETNWEVEPQGSLSDLNDWEGNPRKWEQMEKGDHVFQFHSAEKGCFFESTLELPTLFDIKKLKVIVDEDAAGNDLIWGFTYDGEEIENEGGGDTNGKGYYAWVWTQN